MATAIAEPPHLTADLRALYLSTVASQWRPLAEQAARQRQAPADYLAQLVHLEVTGRRERRIQRRIQDARFPMLKTLDAFSFEAQPDLDRGRAGHAARRGAAAGPSRPQARPARPLRFGHLRRAGLRSARQGRRRPAVRVHQPALRAPESGGDDESAVHALVRGLPRPDGGRRRHRPGRAPRDRTANHGRQLQAGGREAEPGAGSRQEGSSLMPLGCAPRFEPRSGGPAGVSTRCAPPPLRYGPAGDTPSVPPLRQQLWALRPGLDEGVPAVHDVSREATERRRPAGTAGSRFESVAAGMAGSRRWATRAPPRSDEAGLMC